MGGSGGKGYEEPPDCGRNHTELIDLQIADIWEAHRIISEPALNKNQALILKPAKSMVTCCCCVPTGIVFVPEGFRALVTLFGAITDGPEDDKSYPSGCHCLNPLAGVGTLVSKQMIIYDAPVEQCNTVDNIPVDIDAVITLEVVDAKLFITRCGGSARLSEKLRNSKDEALRVLAAAKPISEIYDLCGNDDISDEFLKNCSQEFEENGVKLHSLTVKGVRIPQKYADEWEEKTIFDYENNFKKMKAAFEDLHSKMEESKAKTELECKNVNRAAEDKADIEQEAAIKETKKVVDQADKDIEELVQKSSLVPKKLIEQAKLEVAKIKAQIMAQEREVRAKTEAESARLLAEADAFTKQKETEAAVERATRQANGKKALGEAEGEAAAAFVALRDFKAEMARLDIMEQLLGNRDMTIATSQENTVNMNRENQVVTQVAQQGLEALRAKLAEVTATSMSKLAAASASPAQERMALTGSSPPKSKVKAKASSEEDD